MSRTKTKRNQKRWFVNATGWGFELSLGSGTAQVTGSKVKRGLDASPDSKRLWSSNLGVPSVVMGTCYYYNPISQISQGTSTSGRIGDRIFVENLSLRLLWNNGGASSGIDTTLRCLLVASTTQATTANFTSGGGITSANFFMQNTAAPSLSVVDPQLSRVLCDELVTLHPSIASQSTQLYHELDCPVNAWFEFQPSTGVGVAANLYWLILGDIYGGTPGTTVTGGAECSSLVVFRDES